MRCPNCYGKVDGKNGICLKCGFKMNSLDNASNKKAKELKQSGDGDLVIETNVLPSDVSKKKLLLYCGLLGFFGGHYFYVGKYVRAILNLVISVYSLVFAFFEVLKISGDKTFAYFEFFASILFAFVFVFTIIDFINIALNKFKVPVYVPKK